MSICKRKLCTNVVCCKNLCNKHYGRFSYLRSKRDRVAKAAIYYRKNKETIKKYRRKYYQKNKIKINLKRRLWRAKTRNIRYEQTNNYLAKRRKDINFLLRERIRTRLYLALKRIGKKNYHYSKYIGCTPYQLKRHIESQFKPGMSWKNYGKKDRQWSIDHILPLSSFNLSNKKQFKIATNYKNLQPMWHRENMSKGNKIYV